MINDNILCLSFYLRQDQGTPILGKKTGEPLRFENKTRTWQTYCDGTQDEPETIYKRAITCKLTINSEKPYRFSTRLYVQADHWDTKVNRVTGGNKYEAGKIQKKLSEIEWSIRKAFDKMNDEGEHISTDRFKEVYGGKAKNKPTANTITVEKLAANYLANLRVEGDEMVKESSMKNYRSRVNMILKFSQGMSVRDFDSKAHALNLDLELRKAGKKPRTINTLMGTYKQLIEFAENSIPDYQSRVKKVKTYKVASKFRYYTDEEIEKIKAYVPADAREAWALENHRIAMLTGIAWTDIESATRDNLVIKRDGSKWLESQRNKTKSRSSMVYSSPAFPQILEIIEKSEGEKLFNVMPYQKLYRALEAIGKKIGVKLEIHRARHTYATVMLNSGMPLTMVERYLGHSDSKMTKNYAALLDQGLIQTTAQHKVEIESALRKLG